MWLLVNCTRMKKRPEVVTELAKGYQVSAEQPLKIRARGTFFDQNGTKRTTNDIWTETTEGTYYPRAREEVLTALGNINSNQEEKKALEVKVINKINSMFASLFTKSLAIETLLAGPNEQCDVATPGQVASIVESMDFPPSSDMVDYRPPPMVAKGNVSELITSFTKTTPPIQHLEAFNDTIIDNIVKNFADRFPDMSVHADEDGSIAIGSSTSEQERVDLAAHLMAITTAPIAFVVKDQDVKVAVNCLQDGNLMFEIQDNKEGPKDTSKITVYGSHVDIGRSLYNIDQKASARVEIVDIVPQMIDMVSPKRVTKLDLSPLFKAGEDFAWANWPLDLPPLRHVQVNTHLHPSSQPYNSRDSFIAGYKSMYPSDKDVDLVHGRFVWHGTSHGSFPSILKDGFLPSYRSVQAYGPGEYFGYNAGVSMGYCSHSQGKMLLAFILDGPQTSLHGTYCYVVNNPKDESINIASTNWISPFRWQWKDEGRWEYYLPEVNALIDKNHCLKTQSFSTPPILRLVDGELQVYTIDLTNSRQINESSKYKRAIQRTVEDDIDPSTLQVLGIELSPADNDSITGAFTRYIQDQCGPVVTLLLNNNQRWNFNFNLGVAQWEDKTYMLSIGGDFSSDYSDTESLDSDESDEDLVDIQPKRTGCRTQ
ncbi:hypothetical protein SAMD00019534_023950 [Acytostelium subglobosum LB1]|uniref:hypothetical protein n=1 Tax=Acytostelium subglobosum LB1 TaxID=1410327 RepID=UPI00064483D1|nr:hypothetical protein SAMD00019534_023950 [Acytostelium subglobosum LB1]GAM19220.1 hypothetical protein SAMD00019534_023950 [Acytostelium subglobosum LB1]|eukprot:XP_012757147.1 hypothetical protein SAMD00019534_023950 [Acytostelium subglobosum LB1]